MTHLFNLKEYLFNPSVHGDIYQSCKILLNLTLKKLQGRLFIGRFLYFNTLISMLNCFFPSRSYDIKHFSLFHEFKELRIYFWRFSGQYSLVLFINLKSISLKNNTELNILCQYSLITLF